MPKRLTAEQVSQYQRDGILAPIPVLSPDEVARYRRAYDELEEALGGKPKAVELSQTHLFFRWSYDLVKHPAVLDAVEDVLGPDIIAWASSIFPKQPHDPGFISFHQDGTYWGLDSAQVTTAWIALTESTPENGCMRVVPGSQNEKVHRHEETYAPDNLLSRGQEIQVEIDESRVVDVVLQPGEMSLHHVNIIHGSNPNRSDRKRIGFAPRYITPQVKQVGEHHAVILARGRDDYHCYELMPEPPPARSLDEAVEAQATAARSHLQALRKTESAAGRNLA